MKIELRKFIVAALTLVATSLLADLAEGMKSFNDQSYLTSLSQLMPLAEKGNPIAQRVVGEIYYSGLGVIADKAVGMEWWKKSLSNDDYGSFMLYSFAMASKKAQAVPKMEEMNELISKANSGDIGAELTIANIYSRHSSLHNDAMAIYWYTKAAENNDAFAQKELGDRYHYGVGVNVNWASAIFWYKKAALNHRGDAAMSLGKIYSDGEGTAAEKDESMNWYKIAYGEPNTSAAAVVEVAYLYNKNIDGEFFKNAQRSSLHALELQLNDPKSYIYLAFLLEVGRFQNVDLVRANLLCRHAESAISTHELLKMHHADWVDDAQSSYWKNNKNELEMAQECVRRLDAKLDKIQEGDLDLEIKKSGNALYDLINS